MSHVNAQQRPPRNPFAFAWFVTKDHRWWAYGAISAVIIAESLTSGLSILLKFIVDSATDAASSGYDGGISIWLLALSYPALFFMTENVWRLSGFTGMKLNTYACAIANRKLFAYLTQHSSTYFNERFAGALTNKISNASHGLGHIISSSLWEFIPLFISFITSFLISFITDWRLAVILAIWITIFLSINVFLVRKKQPHAYAVAEHSSTLKGKMVDTATNIAAVHQYSHHEYEQEYVDKYIENYRRAELKNWWLSEWILFLNGALIALFIAVMIVASLLLLINGLITIGSMVMILMIVLSIVHSLFFIGQKMTNFVDDYTQVLEGLTELLIPHEIVDKPEAKYLEVDKGVIEFRNVNFRYSNKQVFEDLSFTVASGQKVGLVGTSGAGKTTVVDLLLRQYELQDGSILIDGQDISSVIRKSLRRNIAIVPQDVSLFHRTIIDNIRYGRISASEEDVINAAKLAQAHDFIEETPDKYYTYVGERGVKLSGGQRQRIAIARAILKNAQILVLDEATSSLDSESEAAIQRALNELMKDKTVLAIAHRLSTLQSMDRIIVIEDGRIVEDGTHEDLLKEGANYAKLWESQVKGFIQ